MMCLTSNKPKNRKEPLKLTQRSHVILRLLLPQDAELQRGFFRALSEEARYFRFMTPLQELPPDMARRFANVDEQSHVALLACVVCGSAETMIGEARYIADDEDASVGEIAIAVADAWQGMGLGRILLLRLASHAAASGMSQLVGDTLASNARMVALARRCGFIMRIHSNAQA
jgi:RimJ/RimL family protein N-acetyltransferase